MNIAHIVHLYEFIKDALAIFKESFFADPFPLIPFPLIPFPLTLFPKYNNL
jgi:hypothetical protein